MEGAICIYWGAFLCNCCDVQEQDGNDGRYSWNTLGQMGSFESAPVGISNNGREQNQLQGVVQGGNCVPQLPLSWFPRQKSVVQNKNHPKLIAPASHCTWGPMLCPVTAGSAGEVRAEGCPVIYLRNRRILVRHPATSPLFSLGRKKNNSFQWRSQ